MNLLTITDDINSFGSSVRAITCARFFRTGKGGYGKDDKFLGLTCTDMRTLAKKYRDISLDLILSLLKSKIHEHRQIALYIMKDMYRYADEKFQKKLVSIYLGNTCNINNWDLVDLSAPHILGLYLLSRPRKILYKLAKSKFLWDRRIAILSTYAFIRNNEFEDTFKIAEILINDKHDLIHKAVGWMLREVGNRDISAEEKFLQKFYKTLPRTMLRYAIEKFPPEKRAMYMKKINL